MAKTRIVSIAASLIVFLICIGSCKKTTQTPDDEKLIREVNDTGFVYSVFTPTIVKSVANSPREFERIRFNAIAFKALNDQGRLPKGSSFPTGSIIVKEAYDDLHGKLIQYAVMKKDPSNQFASKGWLWTEINLDGSKNYSVSEKGEKCTTCHTYPTNRDMTKTFEWR